MSHYYCSIASNEYKYKVLALYNSMVKHDKDFIFFIICMNDEVLASFSALKLANTELIPVKEIEAVYPNLAEARKTRNEKEYAWTIKPSAFLYIFDKYDYIDHVLWLDGDTMFLSDPDPIYMEWDKHSILLTEEKYSGKYEYMSRMYGVYNTGLLGFKRDDNSFECLKWLQARLNEWCYDRMENGLWSDQMYVNDWPQRFKGIKVIKNPGVNMTPFILWRLTVEENSHVVTRSDGIYVNNSRLILFHYYGFRYKSRNEYDLCSYKDWGFSKAVIQNIYVPYINACEAVVQQLKESTAEKPGSKAGKNHDTYCFCTLTTLEYLPKCLALLASIEKNTESFHLWICCMDAMTYDILSRMQLKNVTLLELSEIETESLKSVKPRRRKHEYCWTLKAPLIIHIFENYKDADSILYVDSDVFLFSKPDWCFNLLKEYPVLLTCHNFSKTFKHLYEEKGRFNAGIIGFKRCSTSLRYLNWWQKKCIEWCYDIVSGGRFADQKYLEKFVGQGGGTYIEESIGMNAAIWNIKDVEVNVKKEDIFIDGSLLVFYHFSCFIVLSENEIDLWKWEKLEISDLKKKLIYMPYAKAIAKSIQTVKPYIDDISVIFADVDVKYQVSNGVYIENI
ncbi:MAG: hypothetical protein PHS15_07530 [Clostridiaceae bacterium]|nr:hypothetical protein [Clostridiaceae bacterium]